MGGSGSVGRGSMIRDGKIPCLIRKYVSSVGSLCFILTPWVKVRARTDEAMQAIRGSAAVLSDGLPECGRICWVRFLRGICRAKPDQSKCKGRLTQS